MSLVNQANGRVYVRRFDHDEARARHAAGETIAALADAYGVTVSAIRHVVIPGEQARNLENERRWRMGFCEVCGGEAMRLVGGKARHNHDGRVLCITCRGRERREGVIVGAFDAVVSVHCATCGEWKEPDDFTRGKRYRDLRPGGFHGQCGPCQTKARQAYREARKQPCTSCGALCLPPSERGGKSLNHSTLCRPCWARTLPQRKRAA